MSTKFEEHKNYFSIIYQKKIWGSEISLSGGGSFPTNTIEYRKFLSNFIDKNNINTVYDFGCGDWAFSKLIDWSNTQYTGIEVVEKLVMGNNLQYGNEFIKFEHIEDAKNFYNYSGDLLIVKDVLQHWMNIEIISFLDEVIKNFKYIIITNSSAQHSDWQDTPERDRPLSCKFYPLKKYDIHHILNYQDKEVSIIGKDYNV
jgi:SAM-dependent methyltransferase